MREHDYEPIRGLPERLPEGETLLWQGAPSWKTLAVRAFHLRGLSAYFAIIVGWAVYTAARDEGTLVAVGRSLGIFGGLAAAVIGMVALFAYLQQRTTVYTITNRRVVMRVGIAVPFTVNFPFNELIAGSLRLHTHGTGDIALALRTGKGSSYVLLWPHVRPWHLGRTEPMLRGIDDAAKVAQVLARAAAAAAPASVQVTIGANEAAGANTSADNATVRAPQHAAAA